MVTPFVYDHLQSIEYLSTHQVRIVLVVPFDALSILKEYGPLLNHAATVIETRARAARVSRFIPYPVNQKLAGVV